MTRLGRVGFTLIPLCIGLASAAPSRAAEPETVWLELPDCATPPYDPSELSRSLEVELAPYGLQARVRTPGSTERGTSVHVGLPLCGADGRWLTLQYGDAVGKLSRKRALSLRDVPRPARARTVALVIAYALRPARSMDEEEASDAAPARHEPSRQEALAPAPADPVRVDTLDDLPMRNFPIPLQPVGALAPIDASVAHGTDAEWRRQPLPGSLRLGAGAEWRLLSPRSNVLFGMELNLRGHLLGRSEWALEGAYVDGNTGALDIEWWKAGLGVDYPLTDAPCIRLGPRLALARVESIGVSHSVASVVSAGGRASFSARFARRSSLDVQVEVDHGAYVKSLTVNEASLPWNGWVLTWSAGFSFHI